MLGPKKILGKKLLRVGKKFGLEKNVWSEKFLGEKKKIVR